MARTLTPLPTDKSMWRRLFRVVHPDAGGEHELFIWTQALYEHVAGDYYEEPQPHTRREPSQRSYQSTGERVDFVAAYTNAESFTDLTRAAVAMAGRVGEPYASLLAMLSDCYEAVPTDATLTRQQHQGATYRSLAAIGHRLGMDTSQRSRWYRICEQIPLSQRHAGHLLMKLQKQSSAA